LIYFNLKCIFAFVNPVFGGLYRAGEGNVFDEGTRGKIWRERSVVMGNWEKNGMLKERKIGVSRM